MSPEVLPYDLPGEPKKTQVRRMFDNIAHRYDFLNHFLSFGSDRRWRRKAVKKLSDLKPASILDVATGTGDFALEGSRLQPQRIMAVDFSEEMLEIARNKVARAGLSGKIEFQWADAEDLPFPDTSFEAATVAFGVRNFGNPLKGLSEMHRVLVDGGKLVVLEFAMPRAFPFRQVYAFYFKRFLPAIGRWVSKDNSAYSYLPDSVQAFPQGEEFIELLQRAGFAKAEFTRLSFGIVCLYLATR